MAKRNHNKPAVAADITGQSYHRLDGRWGRSRTIFDSELYRALLAVIEDALGHADDPVSRAAVVIPDVNEHYDSAGLTAAQREVIAMHSEGTSFRQIGVLLGIHHSSVQERYRAGMAKLKAHTPPIVCRT